MKLNVQKIEAEKKAKIARAQSKAQEKLASKATKIRKDFTDMSPCKVDKYEVPITRLTYGYIASHKLKYIKTKDGIVDIDLSWIGGVLLLLSNVVANYPTEFMSKLANEHVTSNTFIVSKHYGEISLDKNLQYRTFEIYNTGLYLESTFTEKDIYSALLGLIRICRMDVAETTFGIVSEAYIERQIDFNKLSSTETIVGLDKVEEMMHNDNYVMTEVSIFEERLPLKELGAVLYVFCKWLYDNLGSNRMKDVPRCKNVGICKDTKRTDVRYNSIFGTEYFIYSNLVDKEIVAFIKKSMTKLELGQDNIKFKFNEIIEHKYNAEKWDSYRKED